VTNSSTFGFTLGEQQIKISDLLYTLPIHFNFSLQEITDSNFATLRLDINAGSVDMTKSYNVSYKDSLEISGGTGGSVILTSYVDKILNWFKSVKDELQKSLEDGTFGEGMKGDPITIVEVTATQSPNIYSGLQGTFSNILR
jgi:hypothetical protein